jgi:hypothetical protein
MHERLILLCAALTGCPVPVMAQDYTKAVDAAWCTGVLASGIEGWRASSKAVDLELAREFEPLRNYYFAFAKGYFRESDGYISFILMGRKSVEECKQVGWRCHSQYPVTAEDYKTHPERIKANKDCNEASPACRRVNACLSGAPGAVPTLQ